MKKLGAIFILVTTPMFSIASVDISPLKRGLVSDQKLIKHAVEAAHLHNEKNLKVLSAEQFRNLDFSDTTLRFEGEYLVATDLLTGNDMVVGYVSEQGGRSSFVMKDEVLDELGGCDCNIGGLKKSKDIVTNPGRRDPVDDIHTTVSRPTNLEMAGNPGNRKDEESGGSDKPTNKEVASNPGKEAGTDGKGDGNSIKDKMDKSKVMSSKKDDADDSSGDDKSQDDDKPSKEEKPPKQEAPKKEATDANQPGSNKQEVYDGVKTDKGTKEYREAREKFVHKMEKEDKTRPKDPAVISAEKHLGFTFEDDTPEEKAKSRENSRIMFDALVSSGMEPDPNRKKDSKRRDAKDDKGPTNGQRSSRWSENRGTNDVDKGSSLMDNRDRDQREVVDKGVSRENFVQTQMDTLGLSERGKADERDKYLKEQKDQMSTHLNPKQNRESYVKEQVSQLGIDNNGRGEGEKGERPSRPEDRLQPGRDARKKAEQKALGVTIDKKGTVTSMKDQMIHEAKKSPDSKGDEDNN